MMNSHSWKMSEKSLLNDSFSFLALADVISSREKSKTSSDRSFRICAPAERRRAGTQSGWRWVIRQEMDCASHRHVVFAERLVGLAGSHDVGDEAGPRMWVANVGEKHRIADSAQRAPFEWVRERDACLTICTKTILILFMKTLSERNTYGSR